MSEELAEQVADAVADAVEPAPAVEVVVIESPEPETPAEIAERQAVYVESEADRIVSIAEAEAKAAVIRARAEAEVRSILGETAGPADDAEPVATEPDVPGEVAPRSQHWLTRKLGRR